MGRIVKLLALVVGFFAFIFLFVGLLWTEWSQALVGLSLAVVARSFGPREPGSRLAPWVELESA
jgi:hypothetical protein